MEKIIWTDAFSVGVPIMDAQHRHIIEIINLIIENPNIGPGSETISDILMRLSRYTHIHFETEERMLLEKNYSELHSQHSDHKEFRKKMAEFCIDAIESEQILAISIKSYLKEWWVDHILIKDMKYKTFFDSQP